MNKTEMMEHLTGKGLWICGEISSQTTTTTQIEWNGTRAGYLLNDDVRLFDDTDPRRARLISVQYTHPRCSERVDRIILYLKTADRRRERRMRRERAKRVREYFKYRNIAKQDVRVQRADERTDGTVMTREEVRDLFIRKGFNLREVRSPDYTVVERNGETVGVIYDEEVYIAENYPSLTSGASQAYADTPKTILMFTRPMTELEKAIEFLLDSPRRLDRETRDKKVENIRKYFKNKAIEKKWSVLL